MYTSGSKLGGKKFEQYIFTTFIVSKTGSSCWNQSFPVDPNPASVFSGRSEAALSSLRVVQRLHFNQFRVDDLLADELKKKKNVITKTRVRKFLWIILCGNTRDRCYHYLNIFANFFRRNLPTIEQIVSIISTRSQSYYH
jgi:hypothetical protein